MVEYFVIDGLLLITKKMIGVVKISKTLRPALCSVLLFLGACSVQQYETDAKYHQVAANTNGNYLPLYDNSGQYQCGLNEHLEAIVKRIKLHPLDPESKKRKILISIHGGLNSINKNIKRVETHYQDALDDGYYPLFIGWRSGATTTLNDRYFRVRNGVDRSKWITVPSSPFYLASDLFRGVAAIPESLWDQGANFVFTHGKRIADSDEEDIEHISEDTKDTIDLYYTGRGHEKSFYEQASYATRQVIPGITRIATTPLIEGVANKSWEMMLRRAKTITYRQGDLIYRGVGKKHSDEHPIPNQCEAQPGFFVENGPNGIVAQLMRALQSLNGEIEIMLVGHSMGAIIANDIVGEFDQLNYTKIIHMASADSVRNLLNKTVPYLTSNPDTQFYNLTLHPTNEEQEQSMMGVAPEGSLLIWLDYILINPETSLDRRAGRWENIKWAFPFFENKNNMHFKLFGLRHDYAYSTGFASATNVEAGGRSEPITHGAFGDFKFWREEFYWGKSD